MPHGAWPGDRSPSGALRFPLKNLAKPLSDAAGSLRLSACSARLPRAPFFPATKAPLPLWGPPSSRGSGARHTAGHGKRGSGRRRRIRTSACTAFAPGEAAAPGACPARRSPTGGPAARSAIRSSAAVPGAPPCGAAAGRSSPLRAELGLAGRADVVPRDVPVRRPDRTRPALERDVLQNHGVGDDPPRADDRRVVAAARRGHHVRGEDGSSAGWYRSGAVGDGQRPVRVRRGRRCGRRRQADEQREDHPSS